VRRFYPSWPLQSAVTAWLGYDPFTNPALGNPGDNETQFVAVLLSDALLSISKQIRKWRVELKKTRRVCAKEFGISVKTLSGWETGRRQPSALLWKRFAALQEHYASCKPVTTHPRLEGAELTSTTAGPMCDIESPRIYVRWQCCRTRQDPLSCARPSKCGHKPARLTSGRTSRI
jgi:DNA-binding transcriptional regulator YiaG